MALKLQNLRLKTQLLLLCYVMLAGFIIRRQDSSGERVGKRNNIPDNIAFRG